MPAGDAGQAAVEDDFRPLFGVVVPTLPRCRFLPQVISQLRRQTWNRWHCALVCDGPSEKARQIVDQLTCGDGRFTFIALDARADDWGYTPRGAALARFRAMNAPPDYALFWDDDNYFHPAALESIRRFLACHQDADVALVPLISGKRQIPGASFDPGAPDLRDLDNANFVMRLRAVLGSYGGDEERGMRGTDPRLFQRMIRDGRRIVLADIPPIGRYDGLRPLMNLRWRLRIPELGCSRWRFLSLLRRWLRS